jgi:hypothetical protein
MKEPEPNKFLYVYLQEMNTNPKLCFDLHKGPLPPDRRRYAKTVLKSSNGAKDKESALKNVEALDYIGFTILVSTLLERRIKQARHYAMIIYPDFSKENLEIHMDEEPYRSDRNGEFYTFLPLRPFPLDLNTEENRLDPVLHMRAGRIVAHALLE